jgi:HlyD family secretion protein
MINNRLCSLTASLLVLLVSLLGLGGCRAEAQPTDRLQGVVELEERDLAFEVGGRLVSVAVKEGDRVEANQTLAVLDTTLEDALRATRSKEAEAAVAQVTLVQAGSRPEEIKALQAELQAMKVSEAQMERNLAREQELLAKAVTTQVMVEESQSRLDATRAQRGALEQRIRLLQRGARKEEVASVQAQAAAAQQAVALEEKRIQLHELKSPMAGTVIEVHADPGEVLGVAAPTVTIADTQHPYAEVFVPQQDLAGVAVGGAAEVFIDAYPTAFRGSVEWIARRTEFTPRYLFSARERPNLVVRVRVRIEDPEQKLFAGTPTFVQLKRGQR